MKKKIGIISALLIIVLVVILAILLTNKKENKPSNFTINGSGISYYYEDENGDYVLENSTEWSTGEYVLDIGESSCDEDSDPEYFIDWDPSNNEVILKTNANISCTLYFDKMLEQEKFFEKLLGKSGEGELLYHNSQLENGANDHGYRYSGDDPNNFICFGPGSEDYNNGTSKTCADKNLYRIIGYVPVTLSNGASTKLIKVIKSEYATASDLGKNKADGTLHFKKDYESLLRIKKAENIDGFDWNEQSGNIWKNSSLYQALNNNENSFIYNLGNWESKIENVKWNVEGYNMVNITAGEMYDKEKNSLYGAKTKVSAKIGLMYPSDYGFASEPKSWVDELIYYDDGDYDGKNQNRENNWLFNGVLEWTILRYTDYQGYAFYVNNTGYMHWDNEIYGHAFGVRPVFYLKSSVTLSGDESIDGSDAHPYRVK